MGDVTEYIAGRNEPARSLLQAFLDRATALVPEAEEGTSYGMAALRYRGKGLVSVLATRRGYSIFPFSAEVVAQVVGDLDGFESTKGGIRFTDAKPIPGEVFDRIVLERRKAIDATLG